MTLTDNEKKYVTWTVHVEIKRLTNLNIPKDSIAYPTYQRKLSALESFLEKA